MTSQKTYNTKPASTSPSMSGKNLRADKLASTQAAFLATPAISLPQSEKSVPSLNAPSLTGSATKTKSSEQNQYFYNIADERSQAQKQRHTKQAEEMYHRNLEIFGIEMTSKKKVQYKPSALFRLQLGEGWFAMITDNEINSQFTVFTMHGSPGDHREWAGLETEMNGKVRWINFVMPGFDGCDERRGNYSGSAEDLGRLIVRILEERKVGKIIFCGHSMGSIYASYFINKYPNIVVGYINVTGIVNQWYLGLMTFYRFTSMAYGFGKGPKQASMIRLLNKNQFRQQHHQRFLNDTREIRFSDQVPFPQLTVSEMCAYVKLFSSLPRGCSQYYELNQQLTLLRMLIFGKKDPLHEIPKTDEQIYSITRGRFRYDFHPRNARLITLMKTELQSTVRQTHGINLKAEKLQEYFCYHFDDTGHNAHKRRPKEISKILRVYLTVLGVIEKYQPLAESKL